MSQRPSALRSWHDALLVTCEEDSRRGIGEYVLREDRPNLSVGQLVDALLRWTTELKPVPTDLAISVLAAAFNRSTVDICNQLEGQLICELTQRVLGWSLSLPADVTFTGHPTECRVLSRMAAAGLYRRVVCRRPLADVAHEACVALQSCRYVEGAQALSVLCAALAEERDRPESATLVRFIDQGYAHLRALAEAHCSAALAWELRLVDITLAQAQPCPC